MKRVLCLLLLMTPFLIIGGPQKKVLKDQGMIIATYNNLPITLKTVSERYPVMFKQFDHKALQDQFQFQTVLTEQHTLDQLLSTLAKKEGIPSAKLYMEQLAKNIPEPTEAEQKALYEKFKGQLSSRGVKDYKGAASMLNSYIKSQKREKVIVDFVTKIKKAHNMKRYNPRPNFPEIEIDISNSPTLGDPKAKVRLVMVSDFECPYCKKFHDIPQQLAKHFGHKISVSFKHLPLGYHKTSLPAAIASVCADQQKKFWPYHDLLFKDTQKHQDADLLAHAKTLKLDIAAFTTCLKAPESVKKVNTDTLLAQQLNVSGTPTLFINGIPTADFNLKNITKEINDRLKGVKSKPLTHKTVIARYDDQKILWGDIVSKYPNAFISERNKQIEARVKFIGEVSSRYLTEHLLANEAKALKIKDGDTYLGQLMKAVADPTDAEMKQTYKMMKARFNGMTFEQVKPQLLQYQKGIKQQQEVQKKLQILAKKYNASLKLPQADLVPFKIDTKRARLIGDTTAKHTISIFSDFQCPYCSKFVATMDQLLKENPKVLKIYFHHFPLSFHPEARNTSIATECAAEQKQFRAMHNKMFEHQNKLGRDFYIDVAKELKLNVDQFKKCLNNPKTAIAIDQEIEAGSRLGVSGTPSLFIDGRPYKGALTPKAIKAAIKTIK